ncbi:MAG: hypothetical protein ABI877_01945 [Gemmatimonadaceae bacterium]
MSIYGIRGSIVGTPAPAVAPKTASSGGALARTERRPLAPAATPATTIGRPQAAPGALSVQPPPGTDPDLWSVLSNDERAYFAKLGAMGPLTYGRVLSGQVQPQQAVSRGARLDVKA